MSFNAACDFVNERNRNKDMCAALDLIRDFTVLYDS